MASNADLGHAMAVELTGAGPWEEGETDDEEEGWSDARGWVVSIAAALVVAVYIEGSHGKAPLN